MPKQLVPSQAELQAIVAAGIHLLDATRRYQARMAHKRFHDVHQSGVVTTFGQLGVAYATLRRHSRDSAPTEQSATQPC